MEELQRLLTKDKKCRHKFEIMHWRDKESIDFGKVMLHKINSMRLDKMKNNKT